MIARKYGVVYTPDRLADFAAELLCAEIEKSEFDSVNVLDPACGECALLDSVKKIKRNEYEYIGIDVDKSAILSASSEYTIINNDTILPKNVRKRTAEFWTGKLPTINAVIANPPWSSEKIYNRDDLRKAGYELTAGQYDSFVLFLELAYKIVCENGIFAFIIPDSIFDSQNENLRRFLIRNTEIKVIARLGEKLFDEVNRATTIIVCKKRKPTVNGEVMFVGKDVADILGYQNGSRDINRHVDEDDRNKVMIFDGNQDKETIIINESGLYSLILSSKMPNAKKFKHWVTAEVLPAIRKHGMYAIDEILENPDLAIAALTQLKEERERRKQLECLALVQRQQIAEMQPKASYYDLILQNKNTVPITQIAKDYGMSGRKFNELLHELGVQYKFRKTWLLYQQYAECGYTQSRTYAIDESRSVMHTYWTQKGRLFLYDLLKNEGILPVIEQED